MKSITFIKDHPSGIKAEEKKTLTDEHADRLVSEGFASHDDAEDTGGSGGNEIANPLNVEVEGAVELKVTKKILKDNPEWETLGIKVGDIILTAPTEE